MQELFLICNAHLDPVWQWRWDEGASAAISTFRVAADFCEQHDDFVFSHNEALLYQWVEEYDPALFERIRKLVAAGKWKIFGGWFLQPDCNLPSGESIMRQMLVGRKYFYEKFSVIPTTAMSFDAFGHAQGMVQIMSQCGYDSYLFMRPEKDKLTLPARNFRWRGYDGSEILTRRLDAPYNTLLGQAVEKLQQWVRTEQCEKISLFPWGVGNHGGGPSKIDLDEINAYRDTKKEIDIHHAVAEDFFTALRAEEDTYPVYDGDLRPTNVGCYTSQIRVKQAHRMLENELFRTEKMCSAASASKLMPYPTFELERAQRDLLFSEFHDILPGSQVQSAEEDALQMMAHGLEILSIVRTRAFFALLAGEARADVGEIPILVYNPHPHSVEDDFSCEFMLPDQNWKEETVVAEIRHNGKLCPSQNEKEESNIPLEWRKRVVFHATLPPFSMSRFSCALHSEPKKKTHILTAATQIDVKTERLHVVINTKTGLIDSYRVDGTEMVQPGAFAPVVFSDVPDSWHMTSPFFAQQPIGQFRVMTSEECAEFCGVDHPIPAVRIIEDGEVRTVVEAALCWENSGICQRYLIPKHGTSIEVTQRIYWNEKDRLLKLRVAPAFNGEQVLAQNMFGAGNVLTDGSENTMQRWCGVFGKEQALTCINDGIYGLHCVDTTIYLTLLRSAGYSAHPIEERQIMPQDRFSPRMEQGERRFRFRIEGGNPRELRAEVEKQAQLFSEPPYVLNAFPSGNGEKPDPFVTLSDDTIILSSCTYHEGRDGYVLRLFNPSSEAKSFTLGMPLLQQLQNISLGAFCVRTFFADSKEGVREINPFLI